MASIKIKQHDIKDCGAACLASIGNYYDVNLPIARIRQYANTDKRGTNVLGIIEAADKMGFTAKGVKGGMDVIDKIPLPAIAHVVVKEQLHHFEQKEPRHQTIFFEILQKYRFPFYQRQGPLLQFCLSLQNK